MCSPCAARPKTSIGPRALEQPREHAARARRGRTAAARPPRRRRRRTTACRPGPSLSVENARAPRASSSTTQTGIEGEQTPVIGPTWSCSLPRLERDLAAPRAARAAARAVRRPALEHARRPAARAAAGRTRGPTRSAARSAAACRRRSPRTTSPAGATVSAPRRARPRCARPRARVGRCDRVAVARPTARVRSASDRRVAARGRAPVDLDDRRALLAQRVGERRQPDVDGARQARSRRRHGPLAVPMADLADLAARRPRPRPACAAKRDLDLLDRLPGAGVDGDDAALVAARRRATSCSAARRSRRRSLRGRPVRRRRRGRGHERRRRARDGRAAARARRHARQPRPRARRARARRPRVGRRTCSACPSSAGTSRSAHAPALSASCTGIGTRAAARAAAARPGDALLAAFCARRPVHERRRCRSSPRCATAPPSALRDRRRGARRGRRGAGSATPRATSRCPASPARCCRCSSAPAAARRSTSTRSPARTARARALAADLPELRLPARRRAPSTREAACAAFTRRGLACAAVRRVRRHRRAARSPPAARRPTVWDLARATHRSRGELSAIAIGWCMTPW